MRFLDSHFHLDGYPDPAEIVGAAASTETLIVTNGVNRDTSELGLAWAMERPDSVAAFVGLHPSEASDDQSVDWLAGLLPKASGAGEIGLDPKYSEIEGKSAQRRLFVEQLRIAEAAGKPLQVHTRNAESACLDELETYKLGPVMLHWFNGESELRRAEQRGYFVSFGPALLNSKKLQRMAAAYNNELILSESDGPIVFESVGGAGGPTTVPSVVFKLAELKRTSFGEMTENIVRNGLRYMPSLGKVKPTTESGLGRKIG